MPGEPTGTRTIAKNAKNVCVCRCARHDCFIFGEKNVRGRLLLNFYNNHGCSTNRHCVHTVYYAFTRDLNRAETYSAPYPTRRETALFSVRRYVFSARVSCKLFQNAERNNKIVKNAFFFFFSFFSLCYYSTSLIDITALNIPRARISTDNLSFFSFFYVVSNE